MPLELLWTANLSATSLHAAVCREARLAASDPVLAAATDEPADALIAAIEELGAPVGTVLRELCNQTIDFPNNRELVDRTYTRLFGSEKASSATISELAGRVADLEAALLRVQPELVEQLAARGRPIREQWEARGPGLMHVLARTTESALVPESATVVLVTPYAGGHGTAHPRTNRVVFEALLANPHAELPEVLRMGWLLAQLNLDLPCYTDVVPADRLARVAPYGLIPAVLAASEEVELAQLDLPTIELALAAWHVQTEGDAAVAATLLDWWEAYSNRSGDFSVALAALAVML